MTREKQIQKEKLEEAWRAAFEKVEEETLCVYDHHAGFVDGFHAAIEKACEWLKENKDHPFIGCEDPCLSGYLTDEFVESFRKAMEE